MKQEETIKTCMVCHKTIFTDKDNYCALEDFKKGEPYFKGYYHTNCFNDSITRGNKFALNLARVFSKYNKKGEAIEYEV